MLDIIVYNPQLYSKEEMKNSYPVLAHKRSKPHDKSILKNVMRYQIT